MASYNPSTLTQEELSCPICFEDYIPQSGSPHLPKLLMCLHTFCRSCVSSLLQTDRTLQCSICRTTHEHVCPDELFDNYVLVDFIKKAQEDGDARLARQQSGESFSVHQQLDDDAQLAREMQQFFDAGGDDAAASASSAAPAKPREPVSMAAAASFASLQEPEDVLCWDSPSSSLDVGRRRSQDVSLARDDTKRRAFRGGASPWNFDDPLEVSTALPKSSGRVDGLWETICAVDEPRRANDANCSDGRRGTDVSCSPATHVDWFRRRSHPAGVAQNWTFENSDPAVPSTSRSSFITSSSVSRRGSAANTSDEDLQLYVDLTSSHSSIDEYSPALSFADLRGDIREESHGGSRHVNVVTLGDDDDVASNDVLTMSITFGDESLNEEDVNDTLDRFGDVSEQLLEDVEHLDDLQLLEEQHLDDEDLLEEERSEGDETLEHDELEMEEDDDSQDVSDRHEDVASSGDELFLELLGDSSDESAGTSYCELLE